MIGLRFGKLTVQATASPKKNGARLAEAWLCVCDCGRTRIAAGFELKRGRITHCRRVHGAIGTQEFSSYNGMKGRCYTESNSDYASYGGRGITICDRWLDGDGCKLGFECFLEDMGPKPTAQHSIDRIDNNGNYTPDNCRWATLAQQASNKRRSIKINYHGREMTLTEAAESIGVPYQTLRDRLFRYGMPLERAMQTIVTASRERT